METLLEGPCRMPYFTDLRLLFQAVGGRQRKFNWLITDLAYSRFGDLDKGSPPFRHSGPHWVTGTDLTQIVEENDLQFEWAVLSGFSTRVVLDLDRLDVEPYADGNPGFWVAQPHIQHPLAEVEIVCWDASAALLLSRDPTIGESFRRFFPEAVDLPACNRANIARR
jgi:hypothetical protein